MSIIRRRTEVEREPVEGCHDGEGTIFVRQLLGEAGDFESGMRFLHETTLPPGTTIGSHRHEGNEELYFFIEGSGTMVVDGQRMPMQAGDVCLTKSGSTHELINDSGAELRIMVVEAGH